MNDFHNAPDPNSVGVTGPADAPACEPDPAMRDQARSEVGASERGGKRARHLRELAAPALWCVGVGLLVSLLPVLILWMKGQPPVWIADSDELLYLAVAGQSYFGHPWHLADPILQGHSDRSMFPWIQFAPGILPACALHLGPLAIGFFWRAFAGASMGLGIFLVIWKIIRRPWMAAAGATWMLSDAGVLTGQPVFQHLAAIRKLALVRGDYLIEGEPQIMRLWRIITPGLSLVYLLAFLFALLHLRASRSRRATVFAGMAFGLLFYVYFYYWTAAALALLICAVLDQGFRRFWIMAGAIGCLIGLPAILGGFSLKNSGGHDWLTRTDNFVSIPHFSEPLWFLAPDCILVASLFWILARRRDVLPVWALSFSGMILANHQIVTGLQIQNYHYVYVFGPVFSLLVVCAVAACAARIGRRRPWLTRLCVAGWCAASLLTGLWLRAAEAVLTAVPVRLQADLREYQSQREGSQGDSRGVRSDSRGVPRDSRSVREDSRSEWIPRLVPDSVIAGDPIFQDFAAILEDQRPLTHYGVLFSPAISNQEWDRRDALNAYLTGQTAEEFEARQREFFQHLVYGPTVHDMTARELRVESRAQEFRKIAQDPDAALREFHVRYLALPAEQRPSQLPALGFESVQDGPVWTIWERKGGAK